MRNSLYTTATCPVCGETFSKHIHAIYCSVQCANKAGRERRSKRRPAPLLKIDAQENYQGDQRLPDHVLLQHLDQLLREYEGAKKAGLIVDGGGGIRLITYSLEAIGNFTPPYPFKRQNFTEYIQIPLTGETREVTRVSVGHHEAFEPVKQSLSPMDILNQLDK